MTNQPLDLALVRQRLCEQGDSKSFWRSLDELADSEESALWSTAICRAI